MLASSDLDGGGMGHVGLAFKCNPVRSGATRR